MTGLPTREQMFALCAEAANRAPRELSDISFDQDAASIPDDAALSIHIDKILDTKGISDAAERRRWQIALLRVAKILRSSSGSESIRAHGDKVTGNTAASILETEGLKGEG